MKRCIIVLAFYHVYAADQSVLTWTGGTGGGTAPATITWSARVGHAAVCFDDGVVVTTGGIYGGSEGSSEVHTTTAGGTALTEVSPTQTTFTERYGHAIARVMGDPDAFLVVGGSGSGGNKNDALLTEDRGVSFVEKSTSVFTSGRYGTALVATGPATFVAYGGTGSSPGMYNEVRQSTNSGGNWTTLRAEGGLGGECSGDAAMWSARNDMAYAYMPLRNRILLAGGWSSEGLEQDVWGSDDGGTCWFQLTADSDGTAPNEYGGASLVVATLGGVEILVLAAGSDSGFNELNSVYRSLDGGASWEVIASSGLIWEARYRSALVYDLANTRLAIMGGETATISGPPTSPLSFRRRLRRRPRGIRGIRGGRVASCGLGRSYVLC